MTAWKDLERRVAVALGGRRAGPMGAAVSDVVGVPWSVECKRSKRGVPEGRMLEQARRQGKDEGKPWLLVVARHNDRAPIVVLEFAEFLGLARSAGRIGPGEGGGVNARSETRSDRSRSKRGTCALTETPARGLSPRPCPVATRQRRRNR